MSDVNLSLRRVERADAAYIMELMNHEQVSQRSMVLTAVTIDRAKQAVKESQDPDNVLDMWMVIRGKKRVGKVNSIWLGDGDMLLGFSISPEAQGKGVATEGLRQLIELLTGDMKRGQNVRASLEPAKRSRIVASSKRATGAKQITSPSSDKKMDSTRRIKRLQALVEPDNIASTRVLEKNDFALVGLIERSAQLGSGANRDLLLYEIDLNKDTK